MEGTVSPLDAWESFYVIVGSSAAALTGLQFVVITLGAERHATSESATRAFGTPTVVHFCVVLLVAAILSAPWHALSSVAVALFVAAIPLPRHPWQSLFAVGAVAVLLLFTGIHNAWDAAAYIATARSALG